MNNVLDVTDLEVTYRSRSSALVAVQDVSFSVGRGEIVGLVGESGCGKSTTVNALLRLLPRAGMVTAGMAVLDGDAGPVDLLSADKKRLRDVRWRDIAIVPQGAMNSLNPVMPVGKQLADGVTAHHDTSTSEVNERISELLSLVGLPERTIYRYAHELSGGMKQRVCIAMALMNRPALVIADEATSALDVIVQRLIAQTILDARDKMGTSFIVIGHDIGLMAQLVDRIAVMYLGRIVEAGPTIDVLTNPKHPYTELLLASVPEVGKEAPSVQNEGLVVSSVTGGCAFRERCPEAMYVCAAETPPVRSRSGGGEFACHLDRHG